MYFWGRRPFETKQGVMRRNGNVKVIHALNESEDKKTSGI